MKTWDKWMFLLVILAGMLGGCKDDPIEDEVEEAPEVTQKVNEFIEVVMKRNYLWYKEMPGLTSGMNSIPRNISRNCSLLKINGPPLLPTLRNQVTVRTEQKKRLGIRW
jgi:succinate dehydrogenase/fumarate reductase flavoprotein subunit